MRFQAQILRTLCHNYDCGMKTLVEFMFITYSFLLFVCVCCYFFIGPVHDFFSSNQMCTLHFDVSLSSLWLHSCCFNYLCGFIFRYFCSVEMTIVITHEQTKRMRFCILYTLRTLKEIQLKMCVIHCNSILKSVLLKLEHQTKFEWLSDSASLLELLLDDHTRQFHRLHSWNGKFALAKCVCA